MRRVATVVAVAVAVMWASYHEAIERLGTVALGEGQAIYSHRDMLELRLGAIPAGPGPLVVWFGDSTIVSLGQASYPMVIGSRLAPIGLRSGFMASVGADMFTHYATLARVLEARPRLVVFVALLRTMNPRGGHTPAFTDLYSEVPLDDWMTTLGLPLATVGMTLPHFGLLRGWHLEGAPDALKTFAGLRVLARRWATRRDVATDVRAAVDVKGALRRTFESYDFPLSRRNPYVRMLEASVRRARGAGAEALVVVAPIPWQSMARLGRYDADVMAGRIATLEDAVGDAGGLVIDLHRFLPPEAFKDAGGHYKPIGTQRLAKRLEPEVRSILLR